MMISLKNHPFAVKAHFKQSVVLTYAISVEDILPMIPNPLQPDLFMNKYAFIAVALVETENLRPSIFPSFMGQDFYLIGLRIFVNYNSPTGKKYRGLYIIKSETNSRWMEIMGNLFTHYGYTTTDIQKKSHSDCISISSKQSGFNFSFYPSNTTIPLPIGSPFPDWQTARKYCGPLPFTFHVNSSNHCILMVEGVRESWKPKPVQIINHHFQYLETLGLNHAQLANAFIIENIDYSWKKGRLEKWQS